ncbi:hypothetical protein ACWGJ2_14995 [Streptomyces sp. NPDC054796]
MSYESTLERVDEWNNGVRPEDRDARVDAQRSHDRGKELRKAALSERREKVDSKAARHGLPVTTTSTGKLAMVNKSGRSLLPFQDHGPYRYERNKYGEVGVERKKGNSEASKAILRGEPAQGSGRRRR